MTLCCSNPNKKPRAVTIEKLGGIPRADGFADFQHALVSETDPEDVLLVESHRHALGRAFAMGALGLLVVLAAGACAVALWLRFQPHKEEVETAIAPSAAPSGPHAEEVGPPSDAYFADAVQFGADVGRGRCDYAVPEDAGICFCQLAGNQQCSGQACACASGCGGDVLNSAQTATFANLGEVGECEESTALLTVPRAYFQDIDFLLQWCPTASRSLLVELMENGFQNYQEQVAAGPVKQCVHAAKTATVPWLHVHTFCSEGFMEGLRKTGDNGWCGVIEHASEVPRMVDELVAWALGAGPLRSPVDFASCRSLGCWLHAPKPLCSCTEDCLNGTNGTCCEDFAESCAV